MEETLFRGWVASIKGWLDCATEVSSAHTEDRLEALRKAARSLTDLQRDLKQNEVPDNWEDTRSVQFSEPVKLSELKVGDIIVADNGFDCMKSGRKEVRADGQGLFVHCSDGRHHLDGQVGKDGDTLIGFGKFTQE